MRIFLDQIGCRLNYSEMEGLARRLAEAGHSIVDEPQQAQVVIFNSCAVTGGAVRDSRKRIGALHRAAPGPRIALTGCYATLDPQAASAMPGVSLVAGNNQKELLPTLLEPWSAEFEDTDSLARLAPDGSPFEFPEETSGPQASSPSAVQVSTPALQRTPAPSSRSRTAATTAAPSASSQACAATAAAAPLEAVVEEIAAHARQGIQEAVLTGVHLGSYGRDLPASRSRQPQAPGRSHPHAHGHHPPAPEQPRTLGTGRRLF